MSTLGLIIAFTFLGGVVGVLMASVFMLAPERVRTRSLPFMVAFATGALLGAALLGLLPEAVELAGPHGYQSVGLSLLGGIALFFILEKLVLWRHCHEDHCETHAPGRAFAGMTSSRRRSSGAMVIVGDTVHNVLDGVLIAAAFLIDSKLGVMTGIAVLAHEVPSEVGDFAVLLHSGMTPGARHVLEPAVGTGFRGRWRAGLLRAGRVAAVAALCTGRVGGLPAVCRGGGPDPRTAPAHGPRKPASGRSFSLASVCCWWRGSKPCSP